MRIRAPPPEAVELDAAADAAARREAPLIVAGGGVLYSDGGRDALRALRRDARVPVAETQAGKGALRLGPSAAGGRDRRHRRAAANALAHDGDVVIAVGTRLQDFTTGSHSLFPQAKLVAINVNAFDALKWRALAVVGDARSDARCARRALAGWTSATPRGRTSATAKRRPGARR